MPTLWTELLGAEIRFCDAGGVRTRSIAAGKGDPVLFIHGIGATAEAFARNIMPFAERFDARAIDILGHGLTATIDGPLSKEAFLDHIVGYMNAAGVESAHVIGNSLGGWLAMWLAILHPERVNRVVNVVGAHLTVPVSPQAEAQAQAGTVRLRTLSQELARDPSRDRLRARLGYVFLDPARDLTDELVDLRWQMFARSTNGKQIAAFIGNPGAENLLTPDVLAKVKAPTMLLWTDRNPSTAAEAAEKAVGYLPNGRVEIMTGCGHWPQWEDTATFNRLVFDFLT